MFDDPCCFGRVRVKAIPRRDAVVGFWVKVTTVHWGYAEGSRGR
jgi:hypothetical protein